MATAKSATYKSELTPLPMRISQLQVERLRAARNRDGLNIQEHVRRALDLYLAKIEREFAKGSNDAEISPQNPAEAPPLASPSISGLPLRRPQPLVRQK